VLTCTKGVSPNHLLVIVVSDMQTMNHTIVDTFPLTQFEGGLNLLHEADDDDDDAVIWLESSATAALVKYYCFTLLFVVGYYTACVWQRCWRHRRDRKCRRSRRLRCSFSGRCRRRASRTSRRSVSSSSGLPTTARRPPGRPSTKTFRPAGARTKSSNYDPVLPSAVVPCSLKQVIAPRAARRYATRRWQFDSRRIYVRPRTGPQSARG